MSLRLRDDTRHRAAIRATSDTSQSLTDTCGVSCISHLIDHIPQMRAHLSGNLIHDDVGDGLHGSNGVDCGNLDTTVFLLLQNDVAGYHCSYALSPPEALDR